ncbi:hypothetical protein AB0H34_47910, partial [Saccharopolyspora shandongensis]|uniref:hypothetical protein n=1 Tax=Saccharopolyspora shandongensis TaxID=418495 RepID=UPI00340BB432
MTFRNLAKKYRVAEPTIAYYLSLAEDLDAERAAETSAVLEAQYRAEMRKSFEAVRGNEAAENRLIGELSRRHFRPEYQVRAIVGADRDPVSSEPVVDMPVDDTSTGQPQDLSVGSEGRAEQRASAVEEAWSQYLRARAEVEHWTQAPAWHEVGESSSGSVAKQRAQQNLEAARAARQEAEQGLRLLGIDDPDAVFAEYDGDLPASDEGSSDSWLEKGKWPAGDEPRVVRLAREIAREMNLHYGGLDPDLRARHQQNLLGVAEVLDRGGEQAARDFVRGLRAEDSLYEGWESRPRGFGGSSDRLNSLLMDDMDVLLDEAGPSGSR